MQQQKHIYSLTISIVNKFCYFICVVNLTIFSHIAILISLLVRISLNPKITKNYGIISIKQYFSVKKLLPSFFNFQIDEFAHRPHSLIFLLYYHHGLENSRFQLPFHHVPPFAHNARIERAPRFTLRTPLLLRLHRCAKSSPVVFYTRRER